MLKLHAVVFCSLAMVLLAGCAAAPIQLHDSAPGEGPLAMIILPEQLEVATVNGREISGAGGLLKKGDTMLEVLPGRYEVLAYYRELWERGDQHDMFRSDPALFIVEAEPGKSYRLDYARPTSMSEARALAGNFEGWVEDLSTGARTPSRASGLQFRRGLIPAATFDDTLVPSAGTSGTGQSVPPLAQAGEPAERSPSQPVALAPQAATLPEAAADEVPRGLESPPATPAESDWLALMKTWWSEASQEERREFLHWISAPR